MGGSRPPAIKIAERGATNKLFGGERNNSAHSNSPLGESPSVVIPVVTFLTPLAEHFSDLKDR